MVLLTHQIVTGLNGFFILLTAQSDNQYQRCHEKFHQYANFSMRIYHNKSLLGQFSILWIGHTLL